MKKMMIYLLLFIATFVAGFLAVLFIFRVTHSCFHF